MRQSHGARPPGFLGDWQAEEFRAPGAKPGWRNGAPVLIKGPGWREGARSDGKGPDWRDGAWTAQGRPDCSRAFRLKAIKPPGGLSKMRETER